MRSSVSVALSWCRCRGTFPCSLAVRGCPLRYAPPATLPWPLSRRTLGTFLRCLITPSFFVSVSCVNSPSCAVKCWYVCPCANSVDSCPPAGSRPLLRGARHVDVHSEHELAPRLWKQGVEVAGGAVPETVGVEEPGRDTSAGVARAGLEVGAIRQVRDADRKTNRDREVIADEGIERRVTRNPPDRVAGHGVTLADDPSEQCRGQPLACERGDAEVDLVLRQIADWLTSELVPESVEVPLVRREDAGVIAPQLQLTVAAQGQLGLHLIVEAGDVAVPEVLRRVHRVHERVAVAHAVDAELVADEACGIRRAHFHRVRSFRTECRIAAGAIPSPVKQAVVRLLERFAVQRLDSHATKGTDVAGTNRRRTAI